MNDTLEPPAATAEPDTLVRRSTVAVVVLVALGAAFVSYRHAYDLVHAHGESGPSAAIGPATVDGLIYAAGMVLLSAARRRIRAPRLAYAGLWLGIAATIGANVAHGWTHGPIGSLVSAWPAVALIISYELLMRLIRSGHDEPAETEPGQDDATETPCPHGVAATVQEAALNAYLHARDCLGEKPSQRQLAAAFDVDRKKLGGWLKTVAQPEPEQEPAEPPVPSLNGHAGATP
jgi:hypothetical protein